MSKYHRSLFRAIPLYSFLVCAFIGLIICNRDIVATIKSMSNLNSNSIGTERSPSHVVSSTKNCQHQGQDITFRDDNYTHYRDGDQIETQRWFRDDLDLVRLIGKGDVSYGFEARYNNNHKNNANTNRTVIAKVATDSDLYYSDIEIGIFGVLNAAPTIPNIPLLKLAIRSMPNPFANANVNNNIINPHHLLANTSIHINTTATTSLSSYLVDELGLTNTDANKLVMKRRISVMVMDLLEGNRRPETLEEVQRLVRSLLETMEFVHSRNIMHCDLHDRNYHWDGRRASLFDWNGGFRYEPNTVRIHYPRAPTHLFPPEAVDNTSAVHASVYAFDVYTIGRITKKLLKRCCGITFEKLRATARNARGSGSRSTNTSTSTSTSTTAFLGGRTRNEAESLLDEILAYELAVYMMLSDPYQRPSTTEALRHAFFERDIPTRHNA